MRSREEILKMVDFESFTNIYYNDEAKIEILLDIRDLLVEIKDTLDRVNR